MVLNQIEFFFYFFLDILLDIWSDIFNLVNTNLNIFAILYILVTFYLFVLNQIDIFLFFWCNILLDIIVMF